MTNSQSSKDVTAADSEDSTPDSQTRDGGVVGWLVVLGSLICHIFVGGAFQAIGPLFVVIQSHFDETSARTSWIIAFLVSVEFGLAPISNVFVKKIGFRMTVLLGTIISSTGYFISAFAPTIEFLYLSIGLAIGLGYAIILPACIGIKAFFIKKRFPIANVLAGSGAGLGVFIFPPLLQTLIDNYGWKGAVIVFSALNAQMGIAAALFRAPEEHNRSASKSEEDVKIAKSSRTCLTSAVDTCDFWLLKKFPTFAIFVLATGISDGIGYQGSPSHMLARAKTKHIGSITDISLLVSIFGLATIIGRLVIPILLYLTGKYTTSLKLYSVAIVLSGTCNLFSPLASNYGGYSTYAFIYGLFMGIVMGIRPQIARDILGPEKVTAGIGLMKFCIAFGALIGPPTGGYIYDVTDEYDNSFYFYGSLLVFGGLMILVLEPLTTRRQRTLEGITNVIVDEPCRYSVSFLEVATQTGEKH